MTATYITTIPPVRWQVRKKNSDIYYILDIFVKMLSITYNNFFF